MAHTHTHRHQTIKCSCGQIIMQCRCIATDKFEQIENEGCPDCQKKAALKNTPVLLTKLYAHIDKDDNWAKGEKLGLTGEALMMFAYACIEIELNVTIDTKTGKTFITHLDGREIAPVARKLNT